jgi:hypothetical protein
VKQDKAVRGLSSRVTPMTGLSSGTTIPAGYDNASALMTKKSQVNQYVDGDFLMGSCYAESRGNLALVTSENAMNKFRYEAHLADGQVRLVECLYDADKNTAIAMLQMLNQELRTLEPHCCEVVRFQWEVEEA